MSPEDREQFRIHLLLQIRASGRFGLGINSLIIGARSAGFRSANSAAVTEEVDYLKDDDGYIANVDKEISPEVEAYRITRKGSDWLARQGH